MPRLTLETATRLVERHTFVDRTASEYGEPGYQNPAGGMILANWNRVPAHVQAGLERRGFDLLWADDWNEASATGKLFKSRPDCHGWTPSYVYYEGTIIGRDEIEADPEWYVENVLLNDPSHCDVFDCRLDRLGFVQHGGTRESGLHPGQNDDPRKVFAELEETGDVVFQHRSSGMFDTHWTAWVRPFAPAALAA